MSADTGMVEKSYGGEDYSADYAPYSSSSSLRSRKNLSGSTLAKSLGYFSVGLGVAQLIAPRRMCEVLGVRDQSGLMQVLGVRELVNGIGILSQPQEQGWLWSRVAGDVMDLGLLATVFEPRYRNHGGLSKVGMFIGGVLLADYFAARQLAYESDGAWRDRTFEARRSIIIDRPIEEIFRFWRDFENLPKVMQHLESVSVIDDKRSHWVVKAPAGMKLEWDAEIISEEPSKFIEWRTVEESDVEHYGKVSFQPTAGDRGTKVEVHLHYKPPGGALGKTVAKIFGEDPQQQLSEDLHFFKQFIETGEISTTKGQPAGRGRGQTWVDRASSSAHAGTH